MSERWECLNVSEKVGVSKCVGKEGVSKYVGKVGVSKCVGKVGVSKCRRGGSV